jgi:hypothetical protein
MRHRFLILVVLLLVIVLLVWASGNILGRYYKGQELRERNLSFEIVVFVCTASAAVLAVMEYRRTAEAERDRKGWEKLNHLETSYQRFREGHLEVIQAFDYPHILRERYLPACEKAIAYDDAEAETQAAAMSSEEMALVRKLDDFLEFFENLYFALSRRLVHVDDVLVFLRYYICLLGERYYDPQEPRLRQYVDKYCDNIVPLLDLVEQQLWKQGRRQHWRRLWQQLRQPEPAAGRQFKNYPRRNPQVRT